jgi:hypothetical protein
VTIIHSVLTGCGYDSRDVQRLTITIMSHATEIRSPYTVFWLLYSVFSILPLSFPPKGLEFVLGSYKFDCAVIKEDTTAFGIVIIKSKQFRSAVLVPAGFGLE